MDTQEFNIGDKVKHKTTNEFEMVIIDFAVYWEGDPNRLSNIAKGLKNLNYPICKYYNKFTNQWEEHRFHSAELILCQG